MLEPAKLCTRDRAPIAAIISTSIISPDQIIMAPIGHVRVAGPQVEVEGASSPTLEPALRGARDRACVVSEPFADEIFEVLKALIKIPSVAHITIAHKAARSEPISTERFGDRKQLIGELRRVVENPVTHRVSPREEARVARL